MGLLEDFTEEEIKEEPEEKKIEEEEEVGGIVLRAETKHESITTDTEVTYNLTLENNTNSDQLIELSAKLLYSTEEEKRVLWEAFLEGEEKLSEPDDDYLEEIELSRNEEENIPVRVKAPEGATYGEKFEIVLDATSKEDTFLSDSITLITTARPTVIAIKTQIGQEKNVADYLAGLSSNRELGIFSILSPKPVRGYIFLEAMSSKPVEEVVKTMRKAKGVVGGESSMEEIEHFLAPKLAVEGIAEGDIVELSAGPFKGEKARVTQIDEANDEITVELFEATVPIPVTVRGDHVRVLEKEKST